MRARGDRVLFMDADLATPVEELDKLTARLDAGADIAIGSRGMNESQVAHRGFARTTASKLFNGITRSLAVNGIRDTQCGFKLFTRNAAHTLFGEAVVDRFAFDAEILARARGRYEVAEVPVVWHPVDGSKVSLGRDGSRMIVDLARTRARLVLGR
jgi:dolichyl-phosphate beta-glucosyltransferase